MSMKLFKIFASAGTLAFMLSSNFALAQTGTAEAKDVSGNIKHNGDLIVKNVASGTTISVTNGGLKVLGKVGDSVQIDQKKSTGSVIISGGDNSTITIDGGSIIVNGKDVSKEVAKASGANDSILDGVEILGDVGQGLRAASSSSIKVMNLGENATLRSVSSISARNVGRGANFQAGNSISTGDIADSAILVAGNSINAGVIGTANIRAGNNIIANQAAQSAILSAGNKITIKARGTQAQDFRP